jgi:hypothetical protein
MAEMGEPTIASSSRGRWVRSTTSRTSCASSELLLMPLIDRSREVQNQAFAEAHGDCCTLS